MSLTDLAIARAARAQPIAEIARQRLGIDAGDLVPYGHDKAKLPLPLLQSLTSRPDGKLVLVTAITPTPPGEGKTTTTIGLADGLQRIGQKVAIALRQPSMGPVFGRKGGATGGGRAQVLPMEDINLHFTGDFHAIAAANNLLAAVIDNHLHQGNALGIDPRRVVFKRVLDVNDRALRRIVTGLGGPAHGVPREAGFDIVVASEVMAVLCLAESLQDLRARLARIVVARTFDGRAVTVADLKAQGAMTVLLKDALAPNLVQTLEGTPAFVHGGPFANIAHGCNSVMATRAALGLADIVLTEAGFGADLGAEKFLDIKCRSAGLWPAAAVVVATVRALAWQGGDERARRAEPDLDALRRGLPNLQRHVQIVREVYGLPCVVAINAFADDHEEERALLQEWGRSEGVEVIEARHWAEGGAGAQTLAQALLRLLQQPAGGDTAPRFVYESADPLWTKLEKVAQRVYRAARIEAPAQVREQLEAWQREGYGGMAVCIAKTPYSFGTKPEERGAIEGQVIDFHEVRLAAGAGFVVALAGDVTTMPGLPRVAAAERIDVDGDGRVVGLA
ncbi:MAG: formate--tetrahydrofolate ligase [Burkholderiales bacterium]|nr:formate--tetrahydrofolate ligase [Burkholderiales bacterium]